MRVGKNLRERRGWTYGAGAILNPLRESGSFFIASSVRTNATDSALVQATNEYRRIASEPIPDAELKSAINNLVGSFPTSMQTVQELSGRIQTLLLYGLPLDYYASYRENLAAITPGDITQAAQKHLTPNALTLVVVGDLSKIEAPIRASNLGTVEVWDADGEQVR